ncbi:hypothetical protein [uncultured Methylibium sp.]|uniref:hypothetical protein n=1 Tax=uncultured Methylibium sp. TaxID=381093 RepID=UPI0025D29485|nr:hypothetical protein [uncultured Methylibium sp.]
MASFGTKPHRFIIRPLRPLQPVASMRNVDVDLTGPSGTGGDPDADEEGGWLASSFDLMRGLRVSETPLDTLPGDLQDAFFRKR